MEEQEEIFVTTDLDYWNSADESYFFLLKGKARPLPELLTPIIEHALEQKLIREASSEEIKSYYYESEIETCIQTGKIRIGRDWNETKKNFEKYKSQQ